MMVGLANSRSNSANPAASRLSAVTAGRQNSAEPNTTGRRPRRVINVIEVIYPVRNRSNAQNRQTERDSSTNQTENTDNQPFDPFWEMFNPNSTSPQNIGSFEEFLNQATQRNPIETLNENERPYERIGRNIEANSNTTETPPIDSTTDDHQMNLEPLGNRNNIHRDLRRPAPFSDIGSLFDSIFDTRPRSRRIRTNRSMDTANEEIELGLNRNHNEMMLNLEQNLGSLIGYVQTLIGLINPWVRTLQTNLESFNTQNSSNGLTSNMDGMQIAYVANELGEMLRTVSETMNSTGGSIAAYSDLANNNNRMFPN